MSGGKYDVIIIGAGPAGIFSAFNLIKNPHLSILMIEKGNSINKRSCPADNGSDGCLSCSTCNKTAGWGGAGAFSDGKLNIAQTDIGVGITEFIKVHDFRRLVGETDQLWLQFGAPREVFGVDKVKIRKIKKMADKAGLMFKVSPIRHIGSDGTIRILANMFTYLNDKVDILFHKEVKQILVDRQRTVKGVILDNGDEYLAKYVVAAPGRGGANWFAGECQRLNLTPFTYPVDLGVRVEVPAKVTSHLTDVLYEAKLSYRSPTFDDLVKTFCMCPNGFVTVENVDGLKRIQGVNGHSYKNKRSANTNFALLVRTNFTTPFKEPIAYGTYVTGLANLLSGGILIQRLGDLIAGRRSTPARIKEGRIKPTLKIAIPGDLSFALPYRHLTNILETLKALDKIASGVFSFDTLLYGIEVKFYSSSPRLTPSLETQINNLFACGDGAGVSRNIVHASVSGLKVAEEIIRREVK